MPPTVENNFLLTLVLLWSFSCVAAVLTICDGALDPLGNVGPHTTRLPPRCSQLLVQFRITAQIETWHMRLRLHDPVAIDLYLGWPNTRT